MHRSLCITRFFPVILALLLTPSFGASAQVTPTRPAAKAPVAVSASAPAPKMATGPGGWIKEFGTMWSFVAPALAYW